MNRRKSTFLIAAAVLLLCGAVFVGGVAGDQGPFPDGGALTSQTYTLTSNVTLMTNLTVPNGVTCTIDLAGHVLKGNGSGSVITVNTGGVLTLKDSNPNSDHHFNTSSTPWVWDSTEASGNVVKGGCITGGSDSAGGGVWNSGTFEMTGGNIVGNSAGYGGGVYVYSGTFNMSGGSITGNTGNTANYGGGVYVAEAGTFNMSGTAEITGNSAIGTEEDPGCGGGVYVNGGTFKVSGAPEISGNKKRTGEEATDNNVYLYGDSKITITGALQDDPGTPTKYAEIGIANPLSGQFGAGSNSPSYSVQPADAACFFQDGNEQVRGVVTGSNDLYWPVAKIVTSGATPVTSYYATVADAVREAGINGIGNEITMIANSTEPTVSVDKEVTLDLNGFVLKNTGGGSVITVSSTGNLTVTDSGSTAEHKFTVDANGLWTLDESTGTKTLAGGCITGGSATGNGGGGVYVVGTSAFAGPGTFRMSGGNIVGNTASADGGGVYVASASISSGVGGTFEMSGGNIVGNTAQKGGGVYVMNEGMFNMTGGTISGNTATVLEGGGVYVAMGATFTMEGGEITGNTAKDGGGGVYVNSGATFKVSGSPVISGNTKSGEETPNANNVCLFNGNFITLVGPMDDDAEIHITSPVTDKFGTVSFTDESLTPAQTDADHFTADIPADGTVVAAELVTADNTYQLEWADAKSITVTQTANGRISTVPVGAAISDKEVKIFTKPFEGYKLKAGFPKVNGESAAPVEGKPNVYTFTMPEVDVEVTAVFEIPSSTPSSKSQGTSTWISTIPSVPGDNTVATDVTYQYTGQKFIPVSAANLEQISAADPAAAAAVEMVLQTASAAGIPLTNSKGAKAIVNTAESVPGTQTETFSQVIEVTSADGSKVTSVPFKVRLSDLAAKNLTTDDVTLYHYLEEYGLWIPLETGLVSTDSTYAYYEAATDGASPFGVLLKKLDAPEVKPIPTKTPAGKSPAPVMGVLAGLGAAAVVFGLRRK